MDWHNDCCKKEIAFYNPGQDGGIELSTRVPDVTAQSARYPFEVTLHQGAIESIFLDSMHTLGISVNRPFIPVAIELSEDKNVLEDVDAYPVKVVLRRIDDDDKYYSSERVGFLIRQ